MCNRIELSTAYVLKLVRMSTEVITTASVVVSSLSSCGGDRFRSLLITLSD